MKKRNIHEAKAKLSEFVEAVEHGERVVICRRNQPVAELVRATAGRKGERPVGTARGVLQVPQTFFEPLPDDVLDTFYPGGGAGAGGAAERAVLAADSAADARRGWHRLGARKGRRR